MLDIINNMDRLFADEKHTTIDRTNSFVIAYPYFIYHFTTKDTLSETDLVIGSHIAYGWMPTMLEIYTQNPNEDLNRGAGILNKVKNREIINDIDFDFLSKLINNSLVGATKLLHFINPHDYSIWDSRVYSYFYQERPHNYRVNKIEKYRNFMNECNEIRNEPRFRNFYESVQQKMGYEISELRAIEVVMFLNGNRI